MNFLVGIDSTNKGKLGDRMCRGRSWGIIMYCKGKMVL